MSRRVLVTGGAGFIGSHIVDAFVARGDTLAVIDDLSRGRREFVAESATFHQFDIRSPEARDLIAAGAFDVICHQAAQIDVRVSVADPQLDADINIAGLLNVLEGARAGGVRRVVFASSGGVVYGEAQEPPFGETAPKLPESPYGASKLASEYYLYLYQRLHGIETVALRYSNVYGPRQDPHGEAGVVAIFSERLNRGEPLLVFGDGAQTRDYVYVGDVARANVLAADAALPDGVGLDRTAFNIGTAIETSVNDLATVIAESAGKPLVLEPRPARAGELQRSSLVVEKASRFLGWSPEMSLAEGFKKTYDWVVGGEV